MKGDECLMWQMDKTIGLEANVFRAMERFTLRTGLQANLVMVSPADLNGQVLDCVGFEVQAMKNVLPGTLWVGRVESE